jgi:hypothetical protein
VWHSLALAAALFAHGAVAQIPTDEVVDQFAQCPDWYQEPTQPGTIVVACDQNQLDHFIALGLTDPGPGGARIDGPDGHDNSVPAGYTSEDPRALPSVRITGSGSPTAVYVATFGVSGVRHSATFAATALPRGVRLQVRWFGGSAALIAPDGHRVATAPLETVHGSPFRMLPRPRGVHARRQGAMVVVSWLARRGISYQIGSGRDRRSAATSEVQFVEAGCAGRRRIAVRLPKGHTWIAVRALHDSTFSRLAPTRVRG